MGLDETAQEQADIYEMELSEFAKFMSEVAETQEKLERGEIWPPPEGF